ncbi:hypothetical protein [Yersinia pekkanenii]|uniref:Uncharacterized protein n=1 Tax=Yersinia pekkanenii TaxID=1288385 RepID=A0A0T9RQ26_9GAMM|nr:hypothetical protein [Yersinia pekkanenii]CNI76554.1 Uncharacterised protein [Yersinia pekkanenii]CRY68654.1 Uncharacterised protein [Yersinia pekkanenii]
MEIMDIETAVLNLVLVVYFAVAAGAFVFSCYCDKARTPFNRDGPAHIAIFSFFWPIYLMMLIGLMPVLLVVWIYEKIVGGVE